MAEQALKQTFAAALTDGAPAASLDAAMADAFPNLNAFREGDDLVLVAGETRRLLIRRVGSDRFRISENAAASGSTNLLDADEGNDRDLAGLIDEISAFAAL
jgi:hypothetical protein